MSEFCRRCGAPIVIAVLSSGRRISLDARPAGQSEGLYVLDPTAGDHMPTAVPVPHKGPMFAVHVCRA